MSPPDVSSPAAFVVPAGHATHALLWTRSFVGQSHPVSPPEASSPAAFVVPAGHATHFLLWARSLTMHVEQSARATTPHDVAWQLVLVKALARLTVAWRGHQPR